MVLSSNSPSALSQQGYLRQIVQKWKMSPFCLLKEDKNTNLFFLGTNNSKHMSNVN